MQKSVIYRRDSLVIKAFSLSLCFEFKLNRPNTISRVSWGKVQGIIELSYGNTNSATDDFISFVSKITCRLFRSGGMPPNTCNAHSLLEFCKRVRSQFLLQGLPRIFQQLLVQHGHISYCPS